MKRQWHNLALLLWLPFVKLAQPHIATFVSNGVAGYTSDGGKAVQTPLNQLTV